MLEGLFKGRNSVLAQQDRILRDFPWLWAVRNYWYPNSTLRRLRVVKDLAEIHTFLRSRPAQNQEVWRFGNSGGLTDIVGQVQPLPGANWGQCCCSISDNCWINYCLVYVQANLAEGLSEEFLIYTTKKDGHALHRLIQDFGPYKEMSKRAREVLRFAQEAVFQLNHEFIGTEHVLMGLLRQWEREDDSLLSKLGIQQAALKEKLQQLMQKGPDVVSFAAKPWSPILTHAIAVAIFDTNARKRAALDSEDLLLGLLSQKDGLAYIILTEIGVVPEKAWEIAWDSTKITSP